MVKRLVVGAHYGTRSWLVQRMTAVLMALYTIFLAVLLAANGPWTFERWTALFTQPAMRIATALFAVAIAWHAWVGARDILMDYVKHDGARLALQVLTVVLLATYVAWAVEVLWR